MGYVIEIGEQPEAAIKRIAKEQLADAGQQLRGEGREKREEAIHEARKDFKKLRAVIRIVRPRLGEDVFQTENAAYREAGQLLAPMRDSYARIEAIDVLIKELDDVDLKKAARVIRKQLSKEYQSVRRDFLKNEEPVQKVLAMIEDAEKRVDDWLISKSDFRAFKKGIKRVYQRGQDAMAVAFDEPTNIEHFHDWRKRVKYLMYHTRILMPLWKPILEPYEAQLDQLSEYLGNAHDFALLYEYLLSYEAFQAGDERHVLAQLDYYRAQFEQAAEPLGMRVYAESKSDFITRLGEYWDAWQTAQP